MRQNIIKNTKMSTKIINLICNIIQMEMSFVLSLGARSCSANMKLHCIKNISNAVNFHINMVVLMKNMIKEVYLIKSCGALGTGRTYAPEILATSGRLSTWFPLE